MASASELYATLRRLERRKIGSLSRDEISDLAREAIARGLRHPPPDGQLQPWVHRIFANLAIDRLRRREVERAVPPPEPCQSPDPEQRLLAAEREHAVRTALAELPAAARDSILRRYFDDRERDGIAMGASRARSTARTRLHKAIARLREKLGSDLRAVLFPVLRTVQVAPVALLGGVMLGSVANPPAPRPAVDVPARISVGKAQHAITRPEPTGPTPAPGAPVDSTAPAIARTAPPSAKRQPHAPEPVAPPAPAAVRFDFEEDAVTGTIQAPDGEPILVDGVAAHPSLIEIPRSWVGELVKTLEDL